MIKSSTEIWQRLHKRGYFSNHRCYQGNKKYSTSGMEIVDAYFDMTKDKSILDLGCGYGRLLRHLVEVSDDVVGVDIAPEPIIEAELILKAVAPDKNWIVLTGNGEQIPLIDNRVDRVISVCVFQHLPRNLAFQLMKEIHRVLKYDGIAAVLFLSGPDINNDIPLNEIAEYSLQYSDYQITEVARRSGFTNFDLIAQPIDDKLSMTWLIAKRAFTI